MIGIISFTKNAMNLQNKIVNLYQNNQFEVYKKGSKNPQQWVIDIWDKCEAIIFICACGIAVRFISKLIESKDADPAIIVIDEHGKYVIPILSGHLGGANKIATEISDFISAIPIITTATDINNKFAIDLWSKDNNCVIHNINFIKYISSKILDDKKVSVSSDFKMLISNNCLIENNFGEIGISISFDENKKPFDKTLVIIPKIVVLGIGCRKNIVSEKLEKFILDTLYEKHISLKSIKSISSVELKKNEKCIIDFSKKYNIPFLTYSSSELKSVSGTFNKSYFVEKTTGVDNVCERSAIKSTNGTLILNKQSYDGMTIAVAKENWEAIF